MKRQLNFFATTTDSIIFHNWLMNSFPEIAVVNYNVSSQPATPIVACVMTPEMHLQGTVCLVTTWAADRLVTTPPGSLVSLDIFSSPVVEYTPPTIDDTNMCVQVGRIYWAYQGTLDRIQTKQITSIFNWITTQTEVVPGYGTWRMYNSVRSYRYLRQWVGNPETNPLYAK